MSQRGWGSVLETSLKECSGSYWAPIETERGSPSWGAKVTQRTPLPEHSGSQFAMTIPVDIRLCAPNSTLPTDAQVHLCPCFLTGGQKPDMRLPSTMGAALLHSTLLYNSYLPMLCMQPSMHPGITKCAFETTGSAIFCNLLCTQPSV